MLMGAVIAVLVGMALTAPISSAALCIMIGIDGIAAGAACVGCCCQMVGFAVASWKDNGLGGTLSQMFGTSMLQFSNIVRRPAIWLAPTFASDAALEKATKNLELCKQKAEEAVAATEVAQRNQEDAVKR